MKKALAYALCLIFVLLPGGLKAEDTYSPIGEVFEGVHAPYMIEGGLPSQTEFFTDEDFSRYRLTLLNLWDSNCANCLYELPFFKRAYEEYSRYGVNIVGVATRILGGTYEHGYELICEYELPYPQVIIDDGIANIAYNCYFVPQTYVIDSSGTVIGFYGGFAQYSQVEKLILNAISVFGDADLDGSASFADVSAMEAYVVGLSELDPLGRTLADIDCDGEVSAEDIALLCQFLLGEAEKQ